MIVEPKGHGAGSQIVRKNSPVLPAPLIRLLRDLLAAGVVYLPLQRDPLGRIQF